LGATVLLLVAAVVLLKRCGIDIVRIEESSMWPVLVGGQDRVLINRMSEAPERFEIWVYGGIQGSRHFVKRVLARPGEHVNLLGGDLWIGTERGALHRAKRSPALVESMWAPVYPEGRRSRDDFVVLGESAEVTFDNDSIVWGPLSRPVSMTLGKDGLGIRDDAMTSSYTWQTGERAVSDVRICFCLEELESSAAFSLTHGLAGPEEARTLRFQDGMLSLLVGSRRVDLGACAVPANLTVETLDGVFRVFVQRGGSERVLLLAEDRDTVRFAGRSDIVLSMSGGSGRIRSLEVLRDVHYFWPPALEGVGPYHVDRGFFMAGDNGAVSADSRQHGPIPADALLGKVVLRVAPFRRWGKLP
jgi:signal peptidase I